MIAPFTPPPLPARFNLAGHLIGARLEAGQGQRPALVLPGGTLSYAELDGRSAKVAHALRAAGVRRGDRVLLVLPDGADFVAALFATLRMGAVGAMANPEMPTDELAYLLGYLGARATVVSPAVATRASAQLHASGAACLVAGHACGFTALGPATERAPTRFDDAPTAPDDQALWLFTSGSTGRPRAAIHSHADFAHHIECYAKGVLDLGPDDVTLAVPKLYFPYATGMNLMFPFAVGAAAVLFPEHPTPELIFTLIERHRPTVLSTVPTMTAKMLAEPGAARRDLSSLRLVVTAGEALPPRLHQRWLETFGVEMLDGIGSAEMFHIYLSSRRGEVRPGSLGRPVPGYRARVVRGDGTDADPGELGTLWVTGPSVLVGYHDDEASTRQVVREHDGARWVVSGDVFRRDGDGDFRYEGRADDMLKVSGIYVSPLEVEQVLAQHPAIAECAVVGCQDQDGLTRPRAYLVPRPGQRADEALFVELAAFARERLAHYKVPRSWIALAALPRNDRGKVLRRVLRDGG